MTTKMHHISCDFQIFFAARTQASSVSKLKFQRVIPSLSARSEAATATANSPRHRGSESLLSQELDCNELPRDLRTRSNL